LSFYVPTPCIPRLSIHDVSGRQVRVLAEGGGVRPPGWRRAGWDGRDEGGSRLSAGVYWIRLEAGGMETTRRITLIR